MKHLKKFNEMLDPMGKWTPLKVDSQESDGLNRPDSINVDTYFIDMDDEIVKCVEVRDNPTNFSPIKTVIGDNNMCYGYSMGGWRGVIKKIISKEEAESLRK